MIKVLNLWKSPLKNKILVNYSKTSTQYYNKKIIKCDEEKGLIQSNTVVKADRILSKLEKGKNHKLFPDRKTYLEIKNITSGNNYTIHQEEIDKGFANNNIELINSLTNIQTDDKEPQKDKVEDQLKNEENKLTNSLHVTSFSSNDTTKVTNFVNTEESEEKQTQKETLESESKTADNEHNNSINIPPISISNLDAHECKNNATIFQESNKTGALEPLNIFKDQPKEVEKDREELLLNLYEGHHIEQSSTPSSFSTIITKSDEQRIDRDEQKTGDNNSDQKSKPNEQNSKGGWKSLDYWNFVLAFIGGGGVVGWYNEFQNNKKLSQEKLYADLENYANNCSSSRISEAGNAQNIFFKRAESLLKEIFQKFKSPTDFVLQAPSPKALANLLYVINAVSNHHMYRFNDGQEARKLLLDGKEFIEEYLKAEKHFVPNKTFSELTYEQKLVTLKQVSSLAEIYTNTMYLMGRTYLYSNQGIELGKEYFDLAKYLGKELKLFETVLSDRGGFCLIEEKKINEDLRNEKCRDAKNKLINIINKYKEIQEDTGEYIEGFKLWTKASEQTKRQPSTDVYNQIECEEQLLKYYGKLIAIVNAAEEKKEYIDQVSDLLFGDSSGKSGVLTNLDNFKTTAKKVASVYNTIGNLLVIINETGVEAGQLQDNLAKKLNLRVIDFNNGELIYKIFEAANNKTADINFTKADSYQGLIMACIRNSKLGECNIDRLSAERDEVNKQLHRGMEYVDPADWACLIKISDNLEVNCSGDSINNNAEETV